MTQARSASYGVVTPPPLQRLLNAVLMLVVSLVQGVGATLRMWRRIEQRECDTPSDTSALPQAKSGIQPHKETSSTHGVIPGLTPGISAGPSRGLTNDPLETDNRDSRHKAENDTVAAAAATRPSALPPPNGGGAPRTPVATTTIRWGTALTPRTVSGCGQTVPHLTCVRCAHLARSSFPARGRTTPAPA